MSIAHIRFTIKVATEVISPPLCMPGLHHTKRKMASAETDPYLLSFLQYFSKHAETFHTLRSRLYIYHLRCMLCGSPNMLTKYKYNPVFIPHICHFIYTGILCGWNILHPKGVICDKTECASKQRK